MPNISISIYIHLDMTISIEEKSDLKWDILLVKTNKKNLC